MAIKCPKCGLVQNWVLIECEDCGEIIEVTDYVKGKSQRGKT